jgi:hypothetical protein
MVQTPDQEIIHREVRRSGRITRSIHASGHPFYREVKRSGRITRSIHAVSHPFYMRMTIWFSL